VTDCLTGTGMLKYDFVAARDFDNGLDFSAEFERPIEIDLLESKTMLARF
jgi:hypothetical protein